MTRHEHDAQRARVLSDRASREVYPDRAAARAAAEAAAERARRMPHIVELDDVEREFLAGLLHDATRQVPGRLSRPQWEIRLANALRDRVRLPARDRRGLTGPADEMGTSDGLGA